MRRLCATLAATVVVTLMLAALLVWPDSDIKPLRRATFELDEPPPSARESLR
jgi:hypothetical protein